MSEIKPCPFCGGEAHMSLPTCRPETPYDPSGRLFPVVRCQSCYAEAAGSNEDYRGSSAIAQWNTRPAEADLTASLNRASDACASVQRERDELREMLGRLLNARALSGVRELVAGWNGEHRPDGPYIERHPSRLGARIETNCGRIYELDEIMQEARAFLARYEGGR